MSHTVQCTPISIKISLRCFGKQLPSSPRLYEICNTVCEKTQCLEVEANGPYNHDNDLRVQNHIKVSTEVQHGLQMIISKLSEATVLNLRSFNRFQGFY
jgi:hypothetical protein